MAHDTTSGVQYLSGSRFEIFVPNLFGGVNNGASPLLIAENEFVDCRSYAPTQKGVLSSAYGQYTDDLNSNLTAVRTTHNGRYKSYAIEATAIYDALTNTAALLSGLTSNTAGGSMATMAGYDLFVNGTEMKKTTDGSTWTDLTAGATDAAPSGLKYIAAYNNRLFGCGHSDGVIRWSDPNDPTEWPALNSWDLNLYDNESYTGMAVWNGRLFAFSELGAYILQGFEFIRVTDYLSNASCTSHRSIISEPEWLIWWGRQGLQMMVQQQGEISRPFEPWRSKYGLIRDRDRSNDSNVAASWYPYQRNATYRFAADGAATAFTYFYPDSRTFFTSSLGAGSSFSNQGIGTIRASDDQLCHMAYGGQIGGWLGGTLSESDDSTRSLTTKEYAPAGNAGECQVETVSLLGQGGAVSATDYVTVNLRLDGSGSNDISHSAEWPSTSRLDWLNFHFRAKCRVFDLVITDVGKGTNQLSSILIKGRIVSA